MFFNGRALFIDALSMLCLSEKNLLWSEPRCSYSYGLRSEGLVYRRFAGEVYCESQSGMLLFLLVLFLPSARCCGAPLILASVGSVHKSRPH